VGALCSAAWTRNARSAASRTDDFYARTLDDAAPVRAMLRRATRLTPARAPSGFAFTGRPDARATAGCWWATPRASSTRSSTAGCTSPSAAAPRPPAPCSTPSRRRRLRRSASPRYAARVRRATELYAGLTQAFYAGTLPDAMFEARTRAARQPWASILAGDVFGDDPPWRAALRASFAASTG
jgi:hypothetical protein